MRTAAKIAVLVTVPLVLGGCAPHYDDVLWRQVVLPYKDLVGQTLISSVKVASWSGMSSVNRKPFGSAQ